jgi:hypothetical protein
MLLASSPVSLIQFTPKSLYIWGVFVYWYGPVRSKQTVRAVPVPLSGPTVGYSSATNHVKIGPVLSKRL